MTGRLAALIVETTRLLRHAAPGWVGACLVLALLEGAGPLLIVLAARYAVHVWQTGGGPLAAGLPLALAFLAGEALRASGRWVRAVARELVQEFVTAEVQKKSSEVGLEFYDSPEFHDRLHRARVESASRPAALVDGVASFASSIVTAAGLAVVVWQVAWWMPLALAAGALPGLAVLIHFRRSEHRLRTQSAAAERKIWYLDGLIATSEAAAELRLFGLGPGCCAQAAGLRGGLRSQRLRHEGRMAAAEVSVSVVSLALAGLLGWRLAGDQLSLADAVLLAQAMLYGTSGARNLFESAAALWINGLFLGNLFEFLALPSQPDTPAQAAAAVPSEIVVSGVSFRYPGAAEEALCGVDLRLRPGEFVAIVGWNGAGKTTLMKLLCGLYEPTAGRIEVNGVDLGAIPASIWRRQVTAMFQEPVRHNDTAGYNIALGKPDPPRLQASAVSASADEVIAKLPRGYQQLLGHHFEAGAELSGGEWSRIALARALHRPSPLILLDEPTGAMDPWTEAAWLARIREACRGRTAVVITHRFATARLADRIVVLEHGQVVEQGTHNELLSRRNGRYAAGWHALQETQPEAVPQ